MKIDFKKSMRVLYAPPRGEWELVEVPPRRFLMVDGRGDPNTAPAYADAVEALYALSYGLKFHSKKALDRDYVVPPLEGLWWAEDMEDFAGRKKSEWEWTMMIPQPDWIEATDVAEIRESVRRKKNPAALERVRFEPYDEGTCLQRLHVGSYDDEAPVLLELHQQVLPERGLVPAGKHHEIYLGDPRRVDASRLRTVLRQPVRRGSDGLGEPS
jgi:hypothetical protein